MNDVYTQYLKATTKIIDDIAETQMDKIEEASKRFADAIANGGLVHVYGSGHSRMAVEEVFPRYGSYPGFHPIV